jgi:hypothetical protein
VTGWPKYESHWPKYEIHKIVQAAMIVRIDEIERNPGTKHVIAVWVKPADDAPEERFEPTHRWMLDMARVGGYALLFRDGFKSISRGHAFEEVYRRCGAGESHLRGALAECRDQFREYERQHLAKEPPDTAKATTNAVFAELCESALGMTP